MTSLNPNDINLPFSARTNGNTHNFHDQFSNYDNCKDCVFEKEKRTVTQKAFERALGISMFLMEEIEKINLKGSNPASNNMNLSRQEIINLLNSNKNAVN